MDKATQFNPEEACVFLATAEADLREVLDVLGFGRVNRKYLIESLKKLNKRSIADRTFSATQLERYCSELRVMFSDLINACGNRGTVGLHTLFEIDKEYFGEGFKENTRTCVINKNLSMVLEKIADDWYKLKYSGELLYALIQMIVWYCRISEHGYEDHWTNATEVFSHSMDNLKVSMRKCGVRV